MAACYSQEKFNVTSDDAMALVIITIQAFAGLWTNGFIVSVLCVAWVKKKIFNSNEKILLFLGCCRFVDLCITWMYSFLILIYPHCFYVHPIPQIFSSVLGFLNSSNVWVSACLGVFYCIKIANFQHTFFIYLKVKIDKMVPWMLFGSVLLSLVMAVFGYDITDRAVLKNLNSTAAKLLETLSVRIDEHMFVMFLIRAFTLTIAFMVVIFSTLLLLFSLWRHKRRMQTNSVRNLNMDAHIKAIKSILFFICIYSITFTGFILLLFYDTKSQYLQVFFISVFQHALSVFHSLILIFSNPKLEKTLLRGLFCFKLKFHEG